MEFITTAEIRRIARNYGPPHTARGFRLASQVQRFLKETFAGRFDLPPLFLGEAVRFDCRGSGRCIVVRRLRGDGLYLVTCYE